MLDKLIAGALQGMGQQQQGGGDLMQVMMGLLAGGGGLGGGAGGGVGGGLGGGVGGGLGGGVGGLAGLVQQFQQAGLGEQVSSWISTGQNMPINADQLMQVFGQGNMQQMAQSAGMQPHDLGSQLSAMLPQFVDKLTPNGQLPTGDLSDGTAAGGGLDQALASLSQLMRR